MKDYSISRRALIGTGGGRYGGLSPAAAPAIEPVKLGPDEKLRVGILGCGNRSEAHLASLNSVDNIEIAALCDILPEKIEKNSKLLKKGNPRRFTNYQEMLAKGDLHAVGIVLPNTLHKEAIIACLQAGKHVLCEKPLTMNVPDCQEVIKAFDQLQEGGAGGHAAPPFRRLPGPVAEAARRPDRRNPVRLGQHLPRRLDQALRRTPPSIRPRTGACTRPTAAR